MSIQENTLLYFISTVPQVLGAMLALIGVFHTVRNGNYTSLIRETVYNIQKLWDYIVTATVIPEAIDPKETNRLIKSLMDSIENLSILRVHSQDLIEVLSIKINKPYSGYSEMMKIQEYCIRIINLTWHVITLKSHIKLLFFVNGIIIGLFLLSFLIAPSLCNNQIMWLIGLGSLLALFSIYTMVVYIIASINEERRDLFGFDIDKRIKRRSRKK